MGSITLHLWFSLMLTIYYRERYPWWGWGYGCLNMNEMRMIPADMLMWTGKSPDKSTLNTCRQLQNFEVWRNSSCLWRAPMVSQYWMIKEENPTYIWNLRVLSIKNTHKKAQVPLKPSVSMYASFCSSYDPLVK